MLKYARFSTESSGSHLPTAPAHHKRTVLHIATTIAECFYCWPASLAHPWKYTTRSLMGFCSRCTYRHGNSAIRIRYSDYNRPYYYFQSSVASQKSGGKTCMGQILIASRVARKSLNRSSFKTLWDRGHVECLTERLHDGLMFVRQVSGAHARFLTSVKD